MFEIDLLHGKGRPSRFSAKRAVIRLAAMLIPVGAALAYAADLQDCQHKIHTLQQTAEQYDVKLTDYAADLRYLSQTQRQISDISKTLDEIGSLLYYRLGVSTAMVEIAERLPPGITIHQINLRRAIRRERIEDEETGKVRYENVMQRSLRLTLCGVDGADNDTTVQHYLNCLTESSALAPLVKEIRTAAREQRELDGKNAVLYELELVLKEQR